MPIVPYIERASLRGELAELLSSRPDVNLYRILPHAPSIAPGFIRAGLAILQATELAPRLRELAILRVGALDDCAYELHHHRRMALASGLTTDEIEAVIGGSTLGAFTEADRAVIAFTDAVVRAVQAPAPIVEAVRRELTPRALVELLMTIGQYMTLSRLLRNLQVELDAPRAAAGHGHQEAT